MLLRAATRSLRVGPAQLRPGLATQARGLAKNNKPRIPQDYRPPPHPRGQYKPDPALNAISNPSRGGANTQNPKVQEAKQVEKDTEIPYSKLQEEFKSSATSEQDASQDEPQIPLHDLTKGIPSTLDAELEEASRKYKQEEKGEEREEAHTSRPSSRGRGDRQMPASAYVTSGDRRRNKLMAWWLAIMGGIAVVGPAFMGRNWDTEEEERQHPDAPNGWGLMLFYNRIKARFGSQLDYYNEPAFPQLLPDSDPIYGRPFTLVLSLEDLLVHSEWSREHGWRMAKRPGVDYFLRYLSNYYEIVVFASVPSMIAQPILQKLDPLRVGIMFQLGREAARYKNGEYIKDLSYLNRDLSKVIHIDTVKSHTSAQPENAIIVPKWKGDPKDKELVAFIPFLEYIAAMNMDDTRKVLTSFEGKEIPAEFARREALARKRFEDEIANSRKNPRRSAGGLFGGMLGTRQSAAAADALDAPMNLAEGFEQGKMIHDQIRERGQKQYEMIEKQIRENGEQWLKEMASEEEKARDEQLKGMKAGLTGWFGSKKPEDEKKN